MKIIKIIIKDINHTNVQVDPYKMEGVKSK